MTLDELREWWQDNDGEGENDEYAHHPSDVFETEQGVGVVLCIMDEEDEEEQADYIVAVRHSLAALFEEHPEYEGRLRVAIDFDDGSDGESLVHTAAFWEGDELIHEAG